MHLPIRGERRTCSHNTRHCTITCITTYACCLCRYPVLEILPDVTSGSCREISHWLLVHPLIYRFSLSLSPSSASLWILLAWIYPGAVRSGGS
uniref:Uncharacterized protein n=1 Tax=Picea glauca TaxID=3330 RepID=A0A101M126_PICGL|nr:hypothetical protein ABT39_MTgene4294 [Picea glauca]QHR91855.1 hypothetical protein Q903MT_gene5891 [Picea sitchensis]